MYNLAYLTQTGQGTTKNEKKAIQALSRCCKQGTLLRIMCLVKTMSWAILGLPQDINKAKNNTLKPQKN